jgi:metallo-beta-lactamase family protein
MATIRFIGAAQEVTGSCHLLESAALGKILLDCGMHQGRDAVDRLKSETFAFHPATIDAVILSHAHLDHSGLLPKLVHDGFTGYIYCTEASIDLLEIMLLDSLGIYERDLERKNRYLSRRGKALITPAYSEADVIRVLDLCDPHLYAKSFSIGNNASVVFHDAGHILGSAIIELTLTERTRTKTLVFTGDLGKKDAVLMNDPVFLSKADIVLMEGTYGNRDHRSDDNSLMELQAVLSETWNRRGNVMIPAFAVGRTQELIYYLGLLHKRGELDNWAVYLDSPMAIKVSRVYDRWMDTMDRTDIRKLGSEDKSVLENFLPQLKLSITTEDSMNINKISSGAIVIAGSGMCTGGRIRQHFKQRIWDTRNTIIFVGFQARGTLGRLLVDGAQAIKMFGEKFVVKAQCATINGFSAHAGQAGLIDWVGHFDNQPTVVLVHGEPESLNALAEKLWHDKGIDALIPTKGSSIAF